MRVRYTPEAFSDRERILEYLRERSPGGARNVAASIREAVAQIGDQPHSSGTQIKAAPARGLTRQWPFCCQVDRPRTGYAARRTSFNATLSFAFRFLTR